MIPIARPLLGGEEKEAILRVLLSGQLAQGENVAAFERRFAELCQVQEAVAVSSGTAALHIAVAAAGIGPGDEVITSPVTDMGTVIGILFQGAIPIFADLDERTYNLLPRAVEAAITPRTKAIMPVHLTGRVCRMDEIMEIANRHGLIVIEDAAQSIGSMYRGRVSGFAHEHRRQVEARL